MSFALLASVDRKSPPVWPTQASAWSARIKPYSISIGLPVGFHEVSQEEYWTFERGDP
jgi:hypothetical protein